MAIRNRRAVLSGPVRVEVRMIREDGPAVQTTVKAPADISTYADSLRDCDREQFAVVLLDSKNHALGLSVTSVGTLDAALVSPGNVFKVALLANAAALVLVHQHPSGDATPSAEDLRITRQLVEAGRLMDIKILDHVVLGNSNEFVSMREEGLVAFT